MGDIDNTSNTSDTSNSNSFEGVKLPLKIDGNIDCLSEKFSKLHSQIEKENDGGYFPIGLNGLWHGGIHLKTNLGDAVATAFDGTIIAARLAENLDDYHYGSGNFILLQHKISGRQVKQFSENETYESSDSDEISFYSLYMHLNNETIEKGNDKISDVKWLGGEEKTLSASVGENGKNVKEDVITVQELLEQLGKYDKGIDGDCGRGTKKAIYDFQKEFMNRPDSLIGKDGRTWNKLLEATEQDSSDGDLIDKLKSGKIVKLNKPVKAGDVLWTAGEFGLDEYKGSTVHWEIFSEEKLFNDWKSVEDKSKKYSLESATKFSEIEGMSDGFSTIDSVLEFYKNNEEAEKVRKYACKFCNEWAIDPKASVESIKDRYIADQVADQIAPYMWWNDAVKEGVSLPSTPVVWHYNPIAFLEDSAPSFGGDLGRINILNLEDLLFNSDSAVILPEGPEEDDDPDGEKEGKQKKVGGLKMIKMLFDYSFSNPEKKLLIFGHTDSTDDNKHNLELSRSRSRSLFYLLTGEREEWIKIVEARSENNLQKKGYRNQDIRNVLTWIQKEYKFEGEPLILKTDDSSINSDDRLAIKRFRNAYNNSGISENFSPEDFEAPSKGDDYWGWLTRKDKPGWGAVFDVYQHYIINTLYADEVKDKDEFDTKYRDKIKKALDWSEVHPDSNVSENEKNSAFENGPYAAIGCGEERPVDRYDFKWKFQDDTKAQKNRRVEALFFDELDAKLIIKNNLLTKQKLPCFDGKDNVCKEFCKSSEKKDDCPVFGKNPNGGFWFKPEYMWDCGNRFITIKLEDENGNGIKNYNYKIIFPHGMKETTGVLDENGFAIIEKLPPGDCKVFFPGLDSSSWNHTAELKNSIMSRPIKEKYTVKQGDCLSSISFSHGFSCNALWEYNTLLKDKRVNPNILFENDIVNIPEKDSAYAICHTDQNHVFKLKNSHFKLNIELSVNGSMISNKSFTLTIDDNEAGKVFGKTDSEGKIESEILISSNALKGKIEFEDNLIFKLKFGHLDPITEYKGVQQRLRNIGFWIKEINGTENKESIDAIKRFQNKRSLEVTGKVNDEFLEKLKLEYGC